MLLRQKPINIENYIKIDSEKNIELHSKKFFPKYFWEGFFYYEISKELESYLRGDE